MPRTQRSTAGASRGGIGHPMLAGVFIGLLIGLCLALAVALYLNRYNPFAARSTPADKPEPRVESPPKAAPPVGMPTATRPRAQAARQADAKRFDFYKILPGTEEAVSEKDLKSRQAPGAAARDVYYLQAGAFQSSSDADNLKARLALAGLEAQIQTATLPDRTVWHRVRVGPYKDPDAMVQARSVLRENKIEPSIIKVAERDTR